MVKKGFEIIIGLAHGAEIYFLLVLAIVSLIKTN